MPIAVDASSTAWASVSFNHVVTSASFNPVAGLLVVAVGAFDDSSATITNNGAALTWTVIQQQTGTVSPNRNYTGLFYTVLSASRTGMTVTATAAGGSLLGTSVKVYVLTGTNTSSPIGGSTKGFHETTNNLTTTGFTVQAAQSLGIVTGAAGTVFTPAPTSSDTVEDAYTDPGGLGGLAGYKSLGAVGSSATFNLDADGAGNTEWRWASCEIKAQAGSGNFLPFFE